MTDGKDGIDTRRPSEEPLAKVIDLGEWEAAVPPSDFAERVLARIRGEGVEASGGPVAAEHTASTAPARKRARRWGAIAGGATMIALAAAVLVRVSAPPARGEAVAKDRIEVTIGARALAVLEPGASVRWDGDDVVQSHGDVFYRVEPGERFTVHTPAGDVEVRGTCFTVKVRPVGGANREGPDMVKRDVKAGAVGAALSALAFVAVYEGKVAVSHASDKVDLRAGESAQLGPDGVKRAGATADGDRAFEAEVASAAADDPMDRANQNLVRQIGEYRTRLEGIAAQKSELEAKLKRTEESLAATQDGSAVPIKHEFDLGQDEWKALLKNGTIKYQVPCFKKGSNGESWSPSPEKLNALGLAPHDAATIKNAYARSNERVWSAVKPLCAQAIGSAEVAEKIGPDTCVHLILDIESARDSETTKEAGRRVAEIRAGTRPMPGPNEPVHPVTKLFLTTTGEMKSFEAELAEAFGPDEAHRIVYSDELCMGASTFSSSPKR